MKLVETGSVFITDIDVGSRLRAVDEDVAQGLAAIIKDSVLLHPISLLRVGNRLRLGPGGHRLRAFQILEREAIPAFIWESEADDPDAEIRMLEITENIGRRELSALDRAAHVAELKTIYVKLHGETRGGDRKSEKSKRQTLPFWSLSDEVSTKMGLSERTVRADAALFDGLTPASRKAVIGTALADNRAQLVVLSKQSLDTPFTEMLRWQLASRAEFDRLVVQNPDSLTDLERAARVLYLQKTAFGGKVTKQSFGVIYDAPARFDISKLMPMLEDVHDRLCGVVIECMGFAEFIGQYDRPETLFYLDPPYWGNETDYGEGSFCRADFELLASLLFKIKGRFILSLNDRPEVRKCFDAFNVKAVTTTYSLGGGGKAKVAKELVITN